MKPGNPHSRSIALPSSVWIGVAAILGSIFIPTLLGSVYWTHTFLLVSLYVVVAILQNMLVAEAGQMSFGQGAIFGIAAAAAAIFTGLHEVDFWLASVGGVLAGLGLGALFAAPALRVQGYYLGFVTLSAALVFPQLLIAFDTITGGVNGIPAYVASLTTPLFGNVTPLALLIAGLALATLFFHAILPHTTLGRRMIVAAKSSEAAQAVGINPGYIRSIAFLLAALGTALAGVLYVPLVGFVGPTAFRVDFSIFFFFAVIVGGQGKLLGPIIGVWILYLVPNVFLADLSHYRLLVYGGVALVVMLAFPDGIVGSIEAWLTRLKGGAAASTLSLRSAFPSSMASTGPKSRPSDDAPLVVVSDARKAFGKSVALGGASIQVRKGTIHGLVGPNGSGKTSMLNVISGFMVLDSGNVELFSKDCTRMAAWRRARLGVGRTFQTPRIFEGLSIWDNVRIGREGFQRKSKGRSYLTTWAKEAVAEWQQKMPGLLPHGQRRLLEILRVLESDAELILLDEPAGGLSAEERQDLARLLVLFRDELGKTIILVEHDLSMVWNVADEITVMEIGEVAASGPPQQIKENPKVKALFTGDSHA